MQQAEPFAAREEIIASLKSTATKFTVVDSPDAVGAGMVNALDAMTALGASPVSDPTRYRPHSPTAPTASASTAATGAAAAAQATPTPSRSTPKRRGRGSPPTPRKS